MINNNFSPIKLNINQNKAVNHIDGPLLILAGAGSGKTKVITERAKNLIKKNVSPKKILCLTFTRKAAREMKERIEIIKSIKNSKGKINITTFHAFALIMLKKYALYWKNFPLSNKFTICDQNDQYEALINIVKKMNLKEELVLSEIKESISNAKNQLKTPEKINDAILKKIWISYQTFLYNRKMIDFDDLLFLIHNMLTENIEIRERIIKKYDFIMVDEYQDTNLVQNKILNLIINSQQNLMVVGDDDQSIYSWRGARIENILNFELDFPNSKTIVLEKNYRSTQHIVNGALGLIKSNLHRRNKNCFSNKTLGSPIETLEGKDPKEEARMICHAINRKMVNENFGCENTNLKIPLNYGNFAILYRTKNQSKPLQDSLYQENIPYRVYGEIDFYDRKEIKDLLAYLKLLVNFDDDLSFLRISNKPKRFRESTLTTLQLLANEEKVSMFQVLNNILTQPPKIESQPNFLKLNEKEKRKGKVFIHIFNKFCKLNGVRNNLQDEYDFDLEVIPKLLTNKQDKINLVDLVKELIEKTEFLSVILNSNEKPELKEKRKRNLNRFYNILEKYQKNTKQASIENFLIYLNFSHNDEDKEEISPMVNLLTIHSAKGLEFPFVYIIGVEENLLPYQKKNEPINEEEERRLLYVAITRAQKECTISLCRKRKNYGIEVKNSPSRFLEEIPKKHINKRYGTHLDTPKIKKIDLGNALKSNALNHLKEILKNK